MHRFKRIDALEGVPNEVHTPVGLSMLHVVGRKRRQEADLVDTLLECHDRIRTFIRLAMTVCERLELQRAEIVESCTRVERYFSIALSLHVEDEESSIAPRLRGRSSTLDAALERMQDQHELHEDMIRRLCVRASALRGAPRDPTARSDLAAVAGPLQAILLDHVEAEEQIIFPAIRQWFSPADEHLVRSEMQVRRLNDGRTVNR